MTATCEPVNEILKRIRKYVKNPAIRLPESVKWGVKREPNGDMLVCVETTAQQLARNMQENVPSAPVFALCLAYWYKQATGTTSRTQVVVTGPPPSDRVALLHWRRSQFILSELSACLRGRLKCTLPAKWTWPKEPVINKELGVREAGDVSTGGEHALEVKIATSEQFLASMREVCPDFKGFERQMPIGLFDGRPRKYGNWTPGGKSQVDLWGTSDGGKTIHLFELKAKGNKKVGILSEAFYYARLLHYVRTGVPGIGPITGDGGSLRAVRNAKRIVTWLTAPEYHPLVYSPVASPLEWVNSAFADDGLEFRILPISADETCFMAANQYGPSTSRRAIGG